MRIHTEYVFFEVTLSIPSNWRDGEDTYSVDVAVKDDAAYKLTLIELNPFLVQAARDIICGPGHPYTVLSIKRSAGCCVFADVPAHLYCKALPGPDGLLSACTDAARKADAMDAAQHAAGGE
jgi:hypothetical protein